MMCSSDYFSKYITCYKRMFSRPWGYSYCWNTHLISFLKRSCLLGMANGDWNSLGTGWKTSEDHQGDETWKGGPDTFAFTKALNISVFFHLSTFHQMSPGIQQTSLDVRCQRCLLEVLWRRNFSWTIFRKSRGTLEALDRPVDCRWCRGCHGWWKCRFGVSEILATKIVQQSVLKDVQWDVQRTGNPAMYHDLIHIYDQQLWFTMKRKS